MSLATLSAVVVALALVGLSVSEDGPLPVERAFGTCDPKCDPCTPALSMFLTSRSENQPLNR